MSLSCLLAARQAAREAAEAAARLAAREQRERWIAEAKAERLAAAVELERGGDSADSAEADDYVEIDDFDVDLNTEETDGEQKEEEEDETFVCEVNRRATLATIVLHFYPNDSLFFYR